MFGTLYDKRSISATKLFILVVTLATGFVLVSLVNTAVAVHSSGVEHNALVLATDPETKTLYVRLFEKDISSDIQVKGEITINTDEALGVMMCNESKSFDDIREGDTLTLMFHDVNAEAFADYINIVASPERMC